jgi:FMN reductase
VTPVFSASYSGLFKTFFDVLELGVLDGKPVLVAATAGTARHSLVLDHALRPLFSYLHAVVVPTGVFAASEDFGALHGSTGTSELGKRVERAANELAALVAGSGVAVRPAAHRRSVEEELTEPTPFEALLKAASDGPPEY